MIIGHKKQCLFLEKSFKNNLFAHAYIFYGPSKIGKKTIALDFIKKLEPEEVYSSNLIAIQPKRKEEKQKAIISVDDIKKLKNRLLLSPVGKGYKAVVIDNAQTMTLDAQGAILKLLEEPRGKSIIFLIVENPNQLLNTIVSRCQLIGFNLVSKKVLRDYFKEAEEKDLWLSFGRPGRMIDYLEDKKNRETQKKRIQQIQELTKSPFYKKFKTAKSLSENRKEALMSLESWLYYFREILLRKIKNKESGKYSFQSLKEIIDTIERTKYVLNNSNINARLALELLFLKI